MVGRKNSPGRPRVLSDKERDESHSKHQATYKANKGRLDMVISLDTQERWMSYLDASGGKREAAFVKLLEKAGF